MRLAPQIREKREERKEKRCCVALRRRILLRLAPSEGFPWAAFLWVGTLQAPIAIFWGTLQRGILGRVSNYMGITLF